MARATAQRTIRSIRTSCSATSRTRPISTCRDSDARGSHGHIEIPQPFKLEEPILRSTPAIALINRTIQPLDFKITKFMVIELVVAILICVFFIGLAKATQGRRAAPRPLPQHARSDAAVLPRQRRPALHRPSRCRQVRAVSVDDFLLRPGLQFVRHDSLDGLADRLAGRDRRRWR